MEDKKYYVTTPIYYATAKPHLGTLYSTVLADVAARLNSIAGKQVYLLTGTDEHGQKIAATALAQSKTPRELVDSFVELFKQIWSLYHIDYTYFIRTTDESHVQGVQRWIEQLMETGAIYKGVYTGWYCVPCETFITDREAVVISEHESPLCPSCSRGTVALEEETYFFRLSAYQEKLLNFYKEHPEFITPAERLQEVISFVEAGLKDLSISRTTITWGIEWPGDPTHRVYVWADALNNYLTAIGYGNPHRKEEFNRWWPADLQVMGKDIVRFHAVYWPAFLMATGLALPKRLLVHGWIKVGDQKMSKSLGNALDPVELAHKYGPESVRYYLIRYLAVTHDSPFSTDDLEKRVNADLANDLGNLLHRLITLAAKHASTTLEAPVQLSSSELALRDSLWSMLDDFNVDIDDYLFHRAYSQVGKFVNTINAYFHAQEPWHLAKSDHERFVQVLSATAHGLYAAALLLWPVMPHKMDELLGALGVTREPGVDYLERLSVDPWLNRFTLTVVPPLFMRYETGAPEQVSTSSNNSSEKALPPITLEEFFKADIRVGTIEQCEIIPKSDKLYLLQINFGLLGIRRICSGIRHYFTPEQLVGTQVACILNLPPRKIMGIESQGMVLTAQSASLVEEKNKVVRLVTVSGPVDNGALFR